jgi:hypothetical protein
MLMPFCSVGPSPPPITMLLGSTALIAS